MGKLICFVILLYLSSCTVIIGHVSKTDVFVIADDITVKVLTKEERDGRFEQEFFQE